MTAAQDSTLRLAIDGAKCASCVARIEQALTAVPGVNSANLNLAERTAQISGTARAADLVAAVRAIGYGATPIIDEERQRAEQDAAERRQARELLRDTALALAVGLPLMLYGMISGDMGVHSGAAQIGWGFAGLATALVLIVPGRRFFVGAWQSLRARHATMDTLVALGTGSAWLYSMLVVLLPESLPHGARHVYFEASAVIVGLVDLGLWLEWRARGQTSEAIRRLIALAPKIARMVRVGADGREEEIDVPLASVRVGDRLRARPGEKIAVDGIVEQGESLLDEAMLTGEPMPVPKRREDGVAAGTINGSGTLVYRATRVGTETLLARIVELVRRAQATRPPIGRLADRIAAVFVPAVVSIALLTALVWYLFGPDPRLVFVTAMTVLVIACPCALGLATPIAVIVGIGKAAELGVLVRNGAALQHAATLDVLVLDKTGTVTQGKPAVTEIVPVGADASSCEEILGLAASLEQGSEHPLAGALLRAARERGMSLTTPDAFESSAGLGVRGVVGGRRVMLGNAELMKAAGIDTTPTADTVVRLAATAATPVHVAIDGRLAGVLAISDPLKPDSIAALARLRALGLRPILLTGDNEHTARAIALQLGIDEVIAGVKPDGKAAVIERLVADGRRVGMVGDGINDAPALAAAQVGFAMGDGTDVAIESSDVALMRSSLDAVADAIEVSRATMRNIRQNLAGAFVYNLAGIPVAAGALYPFTGALLDPMIAGAAMAFSSVTVVSNANRLRFFRLGVTGRKTA